ncbi:MAG: PIN domain-containing protein, partial [Thermoanaerobaculia bacterium]
MRYLLDTNVCSDYLNGRFPTVVERLQSLRPEDVVVSAVAVAELRYGASKSARPVE